MIPSTCRSASAIALFCTIVALPAMSAQGPTSVHAPVGTRVRVSVRSLSDVQYTGLVQSWAGDSLVLAERSANQRTWIPQSVPVSTITSVYALKGHKRGEGTIIGGFIGGFIGAAAFAASYHNEKPKPGEIDPLTLTRGHAAVIGGVLGALLGAVVGASAAPERWTLVWGAPDR